LKHYTFLFITLIGLLFIGCGGSSGTSDNTQSPDETRITLERYDTSKQGPWYEVSTGDALIKEQDTTEIDYKIDPDNRRFIALISGSATLHKAP